MKVNFKSILSLGIMIAFVISPFVAINFNIKEEDDKRVETKKSIETENSSIKENEVKKENKDMKKEKEVPKKETKKETLKPTAKADAKPIKRVKKVNKEKQVVKKNKRAFYLSDYERRIVECVVMGESGGESHKGQIMVAFCILNACLKDDLQPSEVRRIYKYSGWKENPSKSVKNAVSKVFDDGYKPVNDTPIYFYAPKHCDSSWHETQRYICTVGGHKFFGRW